MQVFVNGESLEGVVLEEGGVFRSYDVRVPAEHVCAKVTTTSCSSASEAPTPVDGAMTSPRRWVRSSVLDAPKTQTHDETFVPPMWSTLVSNVEMNGVERRSLAFRAPTTLSYHFEVPERARFVFGLGAEGASATAAGLRARVFVTNEGGERNEIYTHTPGSEWTDAALNLAGYEGEVVRLELEVTGHGEGRVAWSAPAVMVEPPEIEARPEPIQNVVVVLIDTLRADRLRAYDRDSRVRTPVFDRMAAEGVLFEQAQTTENWTKPSCASVLTGLTPVTHRAKTSEARLPQSAELLSEALHEAGFATGSFIANGYVSDRFGFDQGWDDYNNFIRDGRSTEAENVFAEAGDFIEDHRDGRFFTYIQTIDPHVPYDPPQSFLSMYDESSYSGPVQPRLTPDLLESAKQNRVTFSATDQVRLEALHDGEISYHDQELGRFMDRLRELGVADDTVVILTSDHGEEFDDHGSWGHGHSIFQELLGVPLLVHAPSRIASRRVSHTVSTLNIAQTVLDLTRVEGLPNAEGRSLVPDLRGDVPAGPQVAFSDFQEIRRVARSGRYKLVVRANLSSVLFDLAADPNEEHEREVADFPIAGRYMRVLLGQYLGATHRGQWLAAHQDVAPELTVESANMDSEIQAQLRALGYAN